MVSDVNEVKKLKLKGIIIKYAKLIPNTKKSVENKMVINTATPCSFSNAGEINRQNWYIITGRPINIPPKRAIESFTVNILVTFRTCRFISMDRDSVGIISQCMMTSA